VLGRSLQCSVSASGKYDIRFSTKQAEVALSSAEANYMLTSSAS
jgi:hypothetical protein